MTISEDGVCGHCGTTGLVAALGSGSICKKCAWDVINEVMSRPGPREQEFCHECGIISGFVKTTTFKDTSMGICRDCAWQAIDEIGTFLDRKLAKEIASWPRNP